MSSIKDKIKQRADKLKKKKKTDKLKGYRYFTFQFIEKIDEITRSAEDTVVFSMDVSTAVLSYNQQMKSIDPDCTFDINWNNAKLKNEDFKNWRIDGVEITWSKWYLGKNPYSSEKTYIDIGQLWLDGYFDEEE